MKSVLPQKCLQHQSQDKAVFPLCPKEVTTGLHSPASYCSFGPGGTEWAGAELAYHGAEFCTLGHFSHFLPDIKQATRQILIAQKALFFKLKFVSTIILQNAAFWAVSQTYWISHSYRSLESVLWKSIPGILRSLKSLRHWDRSYQLLFFLESPLNLQTFEDGRIWGRVQSSEIREQVTESSLPTQAIPSHGGENEGHHFSPPASGFLLQLQGVMK